MLGRRKGLAASSALDPWKCGSLILSLSLCHPGHGNGSFGGHSLSYRWCVPPIDAVACTIEGAKLAAIGIKDYKFSYLNAISD
jgi:hypothetical protein